MWKGRLGGCCFVGLFEGDLVVGRESAKKEDEGADFEVDDTARN